MRRGRTWGWRVTWGSATVTSMRSEGQGGSGDAHRKHGSESFFIEGEGLVVTQVGGISGEATDPNGAPVNSGAGASDAYCSGMRQ